MKFITWPSMKGYRNIDLKLERILSLLARLNNPHLNLPPTIHIAGTNGKGSTLSFLKSIFTQKKLSVHAYISPHLVNFNERIILAGRDISDEMLNEILLECKIASEVEPQIPVTFFEGVTAAAFLAFSRVKADVLLLETGLGGRLDATNILPKVLCSVITPISFDHQNFLGETLEKIASEKAGIIKNNCPVIIAKQELEALEVIKKRAKEVNARAIIFNENWKIKTEKNRWSYIGKTSMKLDFPSLIGNHQIENASLAIAAALESSLVTLSPDEINSAITKTIHKARLERITEGKLFNKIAKNSELYLDGSHNLQGSQTISEFLKTKEGKKIIVIFSMLKDKDCEGFLKEIAEKIDDLIVMTIPDEPKSLEASEIVEIARNSAVKNIITANNFEDAFSKINDSESSVILICGSLYLAGNFLDSNQEIIQKN